MALDISRADTGLTRLHSFGLGNSAAAPNARLLLATDGNLYGTTSAGGQFGQGALFRIHPDGTGYVLLKSFGEGTNDGSRPIAGLLQATNGAIYGTTEEGGQFGMGTIFQLNQDGSGFTVLKSFSGSTDGGYPEAGLLQSTDGLLYGTASGGGSNDNGVVFRMGADGSAFTTLVQFTGTNGANPESELIEASDGLLYGTTVAGNGSTNAGTVFSLHKDGTSFTVLKRFFYTSTVRTNGAAPLARLVEGTNGVLYGTTSAGGTNGTGTLFALNKDGTGFQTLYHFGTNNAPDGRIPMGDILLASDGLLYGSTFDGGTNGSGTVFRIGQDGSGYAILANLLSPQGPAAGLVESTNGMLYGTTLLGGDSGEGTVFALQKDGTSLIALKSFSASGDDGRSGYSAPISAATNQLVGTTRAGGNMAAGTLYSLRFDGTGYTRLLDLNSNLGPIDPVASLLELSNGTLTGVSRLGGSSNSGTIFSVNESGGGLVVTASSTNSASGVDFRSALIRAGDGLLYGTATSGGANGEGLVFRVGPDGSGYTVLKSFAKGATGPGANPVAALLEGSDGNLYGTTCFGGATNRGVIFSMSKDGTVYNVLKSFGVPAGNGETPMSPLIEASDSMLYGTTYGGGSTNNAGTVFRINKDGTGFQVILAFAGAGADGRHPSGNLVEWTDGAIYGTTERGGMLDQGTIYRVNKNGTGYTILASLGDRWGTYPHGGLVRGPDDALYGATDQGGDSGFGTVFRYGPAFGDIVSFQLANQIPTLTGLGQPGRNYVLQRTTKLGSLASWTTVLSTNAPPMGRFSFPDVGIGLSGATEAFYRLKY